MLQLALWAGALGIKTPACCPQRAVVKSMKIAGFAASRGVVLVLLATLTACGGEPTPVAFRDVVAGIGVRAEGNAIVLTGQALHSGLVQRIAVLHGVLQVNSYLEVEPNRIIGVAPGSPLRVKGDLVSLASGEDFSNESEAVAIAGVGVNASLYRGEPDPAHGVMVHRFQVGQTFELLEGERLRIIGLYRAKESAAEDFILLPLATAQRLYGLEGAVTSAVVSPVSPEQFGQVRKGIEEVLEGER